MTQGGYQVIKILTIKNKMAAAKKQCFFFVLFCFVLFFAISVLNWVFTSAIQSPLFTNDYKFGICVNTYQ